MPRRGPEVPHIAPGPPDGDSERITAQSPPVRVDAVASSSRPKATSVSSKDMSMTRTKV